MFGGAGAGERDSLAGGRRRQHGTALERMLVGVERVYVRDSCEVFESADPLIAAVGFEAAAAWRLEDERGRKIGRAAEVSSWLSRHCCGLAERPLSLHVWAVGNGADPAEPLLRLAKRAALPVSAAGCGCCGGGGCGCCGCCCCRLQALDVFGFDTDGGGGGHDAGDEFFNFGGDHGDGGGGEHGGGGLAEVHLGSVKQVGCRPCCGPQFVVADMVGNELFTIDGPCWHCEVRPEPSRPATHSDGHHVVGHVIPLKQGFYNSLW